jgi:outer membrane receptor for ferrienterochelin and colicin
MPFKFLSFLFVILLISTLGWAADSGKIMGTVVDTDGVAVAGATVKLIEVEPHATLSTTQTSPTGEFSLEAPAKGYSLEVTSEGFADFQTSVEVNSGGTATVEVHLVSKNQSKEMVVRVRTKKRVRHASESTSTVDVGEEMIQALPQAEQIKLPKLIASTAPGVVPGPFGQMFIRGNHANIQYQIDGVQLPDSPSNTFGEAFAPRNIEHMEITTGGIAAEYGQRLAAVVNITSKTGPETPGGAVEVNYGSYNTFSPTATYGGSNSSGDLKYYFSANFNRTDRGLDTPQPVSETDQTQGGTDAVHDYSYGNNQFGKVDWILDNENKMTFILFNSASFYQIPNYPSSFLPSDPFFSATFVDQFGNGPQNGQGPFNYTPSTTDDTQFEQNAYAQVVWKHTFSERSFLQLAPYYKLSYIHVTNDPQNDLISVFNPSITQNNPSSFNEDRNVHNWGLKSDYTWRPDDQHLVKTGLQLQISRAVGSITVIVPNTTVPTTTVSSSDSSPATGYSESAYVQDDFTITKGLTLNAGVRFDAVQFSFSDAYSTDYAFQPRIGLSYLLTDTTKIHVFYGKLFQSAPLENLRDTFVAVGGGNQLAPYDIKAEKDDFWEVGVSQGLPLNQTLAINAYYKSATNMLDDAQLLNTSIAQPYNFATGYAYGAEASLRGQLTDEFSDYVNYSYEIAEGQGISGGLFTGVVPSSSYQYLDHMQMHTLNAGVTFAKSGFWATTQALYGSGLRTGLNNSVSLPTHFSMDLTVGYAFTGSNWWSRFKISADCLNIFNNVYPITVANGFNGSHYAAGREYFVHFVKEI